MIRIVRGNVARKRRKKVLKLAKSFRGTHSTLFRTAKQQVFKALQYAYIGRKQKKRYLCSLWIIRINAAARLHHTNYSRLVSSLKREKISLNKKMLAYLASSDTDVFSQVVLRTTA
uniref:50S ribosomal protein L20 n=1 Tax=Hildenbrandia rivularis TaxID=135206 RepID=A0A1C9CFB6_9FLOR|nr:ribosomal protein L20 [Hildenbrandia rivularis]AOM67081.1 ribosomal protein L20 [Hildenbrandia rivularis]